MRNHGIVKRSAVAVAIVWCFAADPVRPAAAFEPAQEAAAGGEGCACEARLLTVDGRQRLYRVCAPDAVDTQRPVILYLHDRGGSAAASCRGSRWHELGAEKGFITVYGQGCNRADEECVQSRPSGWNAEAVDSGERIDDVAYLRAVVSDVSTVAKVDPTRIHAVGLGEGADMALLLACRAADVFAAIAPINGAPKFAGCGAGEHLSVFPVHGERDDIAPWEGCCAAPLKIGRAPHYVQGCGEFATCRSGVEWSPPVLTGDHPVAALLGFDDLPGLDGVAQDICKGGFGGFEPRDCPDGIPSGVGRCYGVETCGSGPGPVRSEILGLVLAKGRHDLPSLDRQIDLQAYVWRRLETARKALFTVSCPHTVAEVYATPIDPAIPNGTIQRCAPLPSLSKAEIAAAIEPGSPGLVVKTGVSQLLVSYRTELVPGVPAVTTAVLVLPDEALPGPLPVIVGGHGLAGIADACAPSLVSGVKRVTHGWASVGYPSILPDYAGLGGVGVQPSFSTVSVALSLLDGARALLGATRSGATDGRVALVGHSQGGGGSLIAQGLARHYAPDLELAAVVSAASGYEPANPLVSARFPDDDITGGDGAERAIAAAGVYSAFAAVAGEAKAAAVFQPAIRLFTVTVLKSYCLEAIPILNCSGPQLAALCAANRYTPPRTVGEMFTPEALAGIVACLDKQPACTPESKAVVDLLDFNKTPLDPDGPDPLLLAGSNDTVFPPERMACSVRTIEQGFGLNPQVCVSADDHNSIVATQLAFEQEWVKAKLAGDDLPVCPQTLTLPPCPLP